MLIFSIAASTRVLGLHYLPDVTREMSCPSYWTDETEVFMSYEEISELNKKTVSAKGTNMYDLAKLSETVDGIALNEAAKKSAEADIAYFLTWTYLENGKRATKDDFATIKRIIAYRCQHSLEWMLKNQVLLPLLTLKPL